MQFRKSTRIAQLSQPVFKRVYAVRGLRLFGAPVYLHVSAVIAVAVLGLTTFKSPAFGVIAILSYLSIILVHEYGHAFVANCVGLEVLSIQIAWIHGHCVYEDPMDPWRNILVAWGGVAAQVIVAIAVFAIAAAIPGDDLGYFGPVFVFLGIVNLMVAAINLAPSPGLDGAIAWQIVPYLMRNRRRSRPRKSARITAKKRWGIRD